ncbi:histidinol-phosphatase [Marivirga sp.]|uniref:histidinol-phosphatase n=1 Tax=Marivirga sp. TaxID=2018662 RepID=UPI003DA7658F
MKHSTYHSHNHYCDGKYEPEEYLKAAIDLGLTGFGFSSHVPLPFRNKWSMKEADLAKYLQEIRNLKAQYKNRIEVYVGLEVDYVPDMVGPSDPKIKQLGLDYSIGSVHYVDQLEDGTHWEIDGTRTDFLKGFKEIFQGDGKNVIHRYLALTREMVDSQETQIVGHLDKIKIHNKAESPLFSDEDKWYQDKVEETLSIIKERGAIVEVNTRGMYKKLTNEPYPGKMILKRIKQRNIPIMLNSDSHHPREITGSYPEAIELLRELGFKELMALKNNEWQSVAL